MAYYDVQQQGAWPIQAMGNMLNPQQLAQAFWSGGLGQAAYGQPNPQQFGYGQQPFGAFGQVGGWGMQANPWGQPQSNPWGQPQRQLSQQDVGEVVRQLLPILPQILAQAQPQGIGYAAYGMQQRQLSPQDVNEVVRQLLPLVPQIVGALQSQPQLQHAAMYGGYGAGHMQHPAQIASTLGYPQQNFGSPFGIGQHLQQQQFPQQTFGQPGWPNAQAAYGAQAPLGQSWGQPQQRQLSQQDATEVARQLVGIIPQVIGNLQSYNQQRLI